MNDQRWSIHFSPCEDAKPASVAGIHRQRTIACEQNTTVALVETSIAAERAIALNIHLQSFHKRIVLSVTDYLHIVGHRNLYVTHGERLRVVVVVKGSVASGAYAIVAIARKLSEQVGAVNLRYLQATNIQRINLAR